MVGRGRQQREVIVDHQQHVRMARQYVAQARARAALRLQPVGLCARGVRITAWAPASSAASSASARSPAHRPAPHRLQAGHAQRVDAAQEAGCSTTTLSPATVRGQQAFDRVDRAVAEVDGEAGGQSGRTVPACCASGASTSVSPYKRGRRAGRQRRRRVGQPWLGLPPAVGQRAAGRRAFLLAGLGQVADHGAEPALVSATPAVTGVCRRRPPCCG